jgi:hypothetical protein
MYLFYHISAVPLDSLDQPKKNDDDLIRHISNLNLTLPHALISMDIEFD